MQPTPTKAVARGHLTVTLPTMLVLALVSITMHRAFGWNWFAAVMAGSLVSWPVWSFLVPRWRDWVEDSGLSPDDVQDLAAGTGLVWPEGFIIERTEFKRRNGKVGWSPQEAAVIQPPRVFTPAAPADELRTFVGPGADYYMARFGKADPEGGPQRLGFNVAAFFLLYFWLLYRKMYRTFWATFGLMMAATFCASVVYAVRGQAMPIWPNAIITLAAACFLGFLGNWLYYRHALRKLGRVSAFDEDRSEALAHLGGVSWVGPVLFIVLSFGIVAMAVVFVYVLPIL